jgi:transposase
MPIPLRSDFDAVQLRVIARKAKDGPQARRLLALAAVYEGATRIAAAKIGGVTLQIVRDWVMKFNAHGPDGLINKKAPGQLRSSKTSIGRRSPRSSKKVQSQRFTVLCAGGSSISVQWIFEEFRVTISVQTLSRELRTMGFCKLSARPRHHAQADGAIEDFKKVSLPVWRPSRRRKASIPAT